MFGVKYFLVPVGIVVRGSHHQPHHLMMAKGQFAMH